MDSPPICYCNKVGRSIHLGLLTRRFIGCERYGLPRACGYFIWIDPPMCERSRAIILGQLRSMGRHQAEKKVPRKKVIWLEVALALSWCMFGAVVIFVWLYK